MGAPPTPFAKSHSEKQQQNLISRVIYWFKNCGLCHKKTENRPPPGCAPGRLGLHLADFSEFRGSLFNSSLSSRSSSPWGGPRPRLRLQRLPPPPPPFGNRRPRAARSLSRGPRRGPPSLAVAQIRHGWRIGGGWAGMKVGPRGPRGGSGGRPAPRLSPARRSWLMGGGGGEGEGWGGPGPVGGLGLRHGGGAPSEGRGGFSFWGKAGWAGHSILSGGGPRSSVGARWGRGGWPLGRRHPGDGGRGRRGPRLAGAGGWGEIGASATCGPKSDLGPKAGGKGEAWRPPQWGGAHFGAGWEGSRQRGD